MKKEKTIYLASPRGFCGGVRRSLDTVNEALKLFGTPIYVLHQIVHNDYIVDSLQKDGVVFVETLSEVPDGSVLIFSAHGVSKKVEEAAKRAGIKVIDATCPLVKKIHKKARKLQSEGVATLLIGHKNHREIIGTAGQLDIAPIIVESVKDVDKLSDYDGDVAYLTQTTLSIDDVSPIVSALRDRFPQLQGCGDICYATINRQRAVKEIATKCDLFIIIGSNNSSNSQRLKEVGIKSGCMTYLINSVDDLTLEMYSNSNSIGISAGASAPEVLVDGVLAKLGSEGWNIIEKVPFYQENLEFPLPVIN